MKQLRLMLVAGEASGDLLAAELVKALRDSPQVKVMPFPPEFFGAGGPKMAEAGVKLAVDMTPYAVIGPTDALKKYRPLRSVFRQLFNLARERQPDVIIGIDYSGFNSRFARAIKKHVDTRAGSFLNWKPKVVQYVSPQVWASRPGRAHQLARDVDLLLSIFPFEKDWYAARVPDLRVEFVGHPIVERYSHVRRVAPHESSRAPLVLFLPGSRLAELKHHVPLLADLAALLRAAKPNARFKMILPDEDLKRQAAQRLPGGSDLELQIGGLSEALSEADLAITKSGTVTLECGFCGVPAVVFYRASWPSYWIARRLVNVEFLAMPNLLASEEIYPEFIQHEATTETIADAALRLLDDPERQKAIRAKLGRVAESLGAPGASKRAAEAVLSLIEQEPFPLRASLAG